MCTLFESPVNPMVAVLYKECKEECKFTDKSDSDFMLFLLNSAVRILNVVKDFSPLLEGVTAPPSPVDPPEASVPLNNALDVSKEQSANKSPEIRNSSSEYEDILLEKLEKSSDLETLQRYIDKVQQSLEEMPPLQGNASSFSESEVVGEREDNERNKTPGNEENNENTDTVNAQNSEDILTEAISEISEILNKAHFDEDLRKITGISSISTPEGGAFSCSICFTRFKNQRNLSRHIRLGVCLEKNFNCKLCDHSFATEYGLKRHLSRTMCKKRAIEENVSVSPSKAAKTSEEDSPAQFVCEQCSFTFATKAALTQHASSSKCENNRIQGLSSKETRPPGFFQCPHCKSTLASKAGLAKHLKRAQCRVYQCPSCTKSFRYLHEVRTHRRLEHKDSDEVNTSIAKNFFNTMGGIPTMTYTTNILSNINALPYLRGNQLDVSSHLCKVCSYTGTCKRSLENHMRMHVRQLKAIGENKNCTQCDFTSDDQNELLKHYISVHPGLPYFKMAPKGTFIVRSNRIIDPKKAAGEEGDKNEGRGKSFEGDNTGTSDDGDSVIDTKLELSVPLTDLPNSESEEIDCVSLNSQCIRESLQEDNEISCDT